MRILRLDLQEGEELDLHPYVTMLGGLDPGLQRRVVEQLARISRGDVEGVSGLVETHGILVEIDPARIGALGLPSVADVVVEAEQLPGARIVQTAESENELHRSIRAKMVAAEAEVERLNGDIAHVTAGIERQSQELDEARRSVDEFAVTAHDAALRAVAEAEDLARRRIGANEAPAAPQVAAQSPQDVERERLASELAELRNRQRDLEAVLDEERLGLLQLLEQLEAERARLDELRAELGTSGIEVSPEPEPDPEPVGPPPELVAEIGRTIDEVVAGPPQAPMVPSLPAAALADQVAAHRQRQADLERGMVERGLDPEPVRQRLAQAQRAEAEAATAARPRTVSPEDDAEIERLHDLVVANSDKRESRRHGKEATRVYDEASAALDEVLGRYGFETYAAFIMGRTAPAIDMEARQRHQEAQQLVASLQNELAEIETAIADDPHGRMLRAERDEIWRAARELLGGVPDDLEGALRDLKVPGEVDFDAPDRLRSLLRRVGVDTSHAATSGALLSVADTWYREVTQPGDAAPFRDSGFAAPVAATPADPIAHQQALISDLLERSHKLDHELTLREDSAQQLAERIEATEGALVSLDSEREAQRSAREAETAAAAAAAPNPEELLNQQLAADPTVAAAREQVAMVAARLERHQVAVERVDRLHAAIGDARRTERTITAQRDSLLAEIDTLRREADKALDAGTPLPPVEWHLTDEGIGPIEWYLLGRVASLRSVSAAGSVPLVINDAFRGLGSSEIAGLCAALARIGETVQVIYLGDELAMVEWAEAQGLDRAAVVRPGQPAL